MGSLMDTVSDSTFREGEAQAWPKVAIAVLNWNGWRDTLECLESLQRMTYPHYQIIVVDNGYLREFSALSASPASGHPRSSGHASGDRPRG